MKLITLKEAADRLSFSAQTPYNVEAFLELFPIGRKGHLERTVGEAMAEKLNPRQIVTFEELLMTVLYEQEALRRVLIRKGVLTNEEVVEEIKAVRRELEGKRGR